MFYTFPVTLILTEEAMLYNYIIDRKRYKKILIPLYRVEFLEQTELQVG